MITFDDVSELEKALKRAKSADTKIKIRMLKESHYQVSSGRDENIWYDATCGRLPNGKKFISCGCIAGQNNKICRHAPILAELHSAVIKVKTVQKVA